MDKSGLNPKQQFPNGDMTEDIPEALREISDYRKPSPNNWLWLLAGGFASIGLIALAVVFLVPGNSSSDSTDVETSSTTDTTSAPETSVDGEEVTAVEETPQEDNILGHKAYQEAAATDLEPIYAGSAIRMRPAAAQKLREMVAAAGASGINISIISGYRSIEEQKYLFFEIKEQRSQDTSVRAKVSAPPGYSEHHTGYAVDVADGNAPGTNLSQSFEQTRAFAWMQQNAARYSFELSFPRDNPQGISYEPWHWRYVGDTDSLETFYKNR